MSQFPPRPNVPRGQVRYNSKIGSSQPLIENRIRPPRGTMMSTDTQSWVPQQSSRSPTIRLLLALIIRVLLADMFQMLIIKRATTTSTDMSITTEEFPTDRADTIAPTISLRDTPTQAWDRGFSLGLKPHCSGRTSSVYSGFTSSR